MARKPDANLENQIREIRKQLTDQVGCLEFRTESKLSLINELRDFFKKRGDIEFEYAKGLERICERFESRTKQRNIKYEVRSTFNLWSTMLAETRRMAKDRANLAETMAAELVARLDIMAKDVMLMSRKCKELFIEVQDGYTKELKELNDHTKVYQYACHHSAESYGKLVKAKEKVEQAKSNAARRKKAEEKEQERQRQFNELKHRQMKSRNDYLLRIASANARSSQYFKTDLMDIMEFLEYDYHDSFKRLAIAYRDAEESASQNVVKAANSIVDQTKALNFENDRNYFFSEFSNAFSQQLQFAFVPYGDDEVSDYKVNTKDVFVKAQEMVENYKEEIKTMEIQIDGDSKTVEHMWKVNLLKYKVQTIEDALALMEEAGEQLPAEPSRSSVLERGSLNPTTRAVHALHHSQKGKEDTLTFTLEVFRRKQGRLASMMMYLARLAILEKSLDEQKVPPISIDGDYRIPRLFGGDCYEYIKATATGIPLVLKSCCNAIEKEGLTTEGIFRIPGPAQQIEDLKYAFEEGRDPLSFSNKKVEITAVASVLKLYFRELSNPLFPCDRYYDFIKCTRKDDHYERLEALKQTINSLNTCIVTVMRYLFRFLLRVSKYSSETKMNTANLAVVFGPTLTRAPPDADPRLLHNDVPAINVLIQLCIEQNEFIFGADENEKTYSPPPPPAAPESPSITDGQTETHYPVAQNEDEWMEPPADLEEPTNELVMSQEEPHPPEPHPPEPLSPKEEQVAEGEVEYDEETCPLPNVQPQPKPEPTQEPIPEPTEEPVSQATTEAVFTETPPTDGLTRAPESTVSISKDINFVDETMQDIASEIEDMRRKSTGGDGQEEGEEDGDSDSDAEEVLTIAAKALYDYKARNEKELSFQKGAMLDVVEKTEDGNWWDGFYEGRRGYIPVSYVEISELQAPTPPTRKSSMPKPESTSKAPATPTITTLEEVPSETPPTEPQASPTETKPTNEDISPAERKRSDTTPPRISPPPEQSPKKKAPPIPCKPGAVSKLAQQFQQPPPQAPPPQTPPPSKILVGPHTHRRGNSTDLNVIRSGSGGSQSQMKQSLPPKPKNTTPFQLMSHDSTASASPLQKAQLQQQIKGSSTAPIKKGRSSSKKNSDKPPLPNKPAAPPKFSVPSQTAQLNAELAAATAHLKRNEDKN